MNRDRATRPSVVAGEQAKWFVSQIASWFLSPSPQSRGDGEQCGFARFNHSYSFLRVKFQQNGRGLPFVNSSYSRSRTLNASKFGLSFGVRTFRCTREKSCTGGSRGSFFESTPRAVGKVSFYPHHGAWWLYCREAVQPVRRKVAETRDDAEKLAEASPTLLSFQPAQLHWLDDAVDDHRGAEACPQAKEEHLAPLAAPKGLHGGIIGYLVGGVFGDRPIARELA